MLSKGLIKHLAETRQTIIINTDHMASCSFLLFPTTPCYLLSHVLTTECSNSSCCWTCVLLHHIITVTKLLPEAFQQSHCNFDLACILSHLALRCSACQSCSIVANITQPCCMLTLVYDGYTKPGKSPLLIMQEHSHILEAGSASSNSR